MIVLGIMFLVFYILIFLFAKITVTRNEVKENVGIIGRFVGSFIGSICFTLLFGLPVLGILKLCGL